MIAASGTLAWRALLKMKNTAVEQLIDLAIMPVIFLLIFQYLFGGAFAGSTTNYLQYFLPGVLVMSAIMQTTATGSAVKDDIAKGIFDRFRTMPFWQPASLVGTMIADMVRYLLALTMTFALGMLLGFRPAAGVPGALAAILLIALVAFAFAWIFTAVAMVVRKTETLTSASMALMAVVFCSNIFVSPSTMPTWMRMIVEINPTSHAATAVRGLMHGTATPGQLGLVLLSAGAVAAVFAPLTIYLYNKKRH